MEQPLNKNESTSADAKATDKTEPARGEYQPKRSTVAQLAKEYNYSERQIRRMIQIIRPQIGKKKGHYLTLEQVEKFVNHWGKPYLIALGLTEATNANAAQNASQLTNGSDIVPSSEHSSISYYAGLILVWWLIQVCLVSFYIKELIERFIDTPATRQLNLQRKLDKAVRRRDNLRIAKLIILITIVMAGGAVVGGAAGYYAKKNYPPKEVKKKMERRK